jgi:glycosyltransferase involved in cell wall biosynthesis
MADVILDLFANPALRRRLELAGREYVTRHHRWEALAASLVRTFDAARLLES